ncbi:uncharacterized protein [Elaeis guineensis]|uniref:uncharacterized protein n=1 Tax=Elaeis guineensis var. tenera TaxID=51953 RepID=UPI003C6D6971
MDWEELVEKHAGTNHPNPRRLGICQAWLKLVIYDISVSRPFRGKNHELRQIRTVFSGPWIIGGDFNAACKIGERNGLSQAKKVLKGCRSFVRRSQLIDSNVRVKIAWLDLTRSGFERLLPSSLSLAMAADDQHHLSGGRPAPPLQRLMWCLIKIILQLLRNFRRAIFRHLEDLIWIQFCQLSSGSFTTCFQAILVA